MDVLSNILYSLRVQGSVYFCSNVEPPWKKSYENRTSAAFHSIRSGTCWLEVNDKVEQLYLSGNTIGDKGAVALAEALSKNGTLKELTVKNCGIGEEGKAALEKVRLDGGSALEKVALE